MRPFESSLALLALTPTHSLYHTRTIPRSELDESEDWMTAAGDLREGNINEKLRVGACVWRLRHPLSLVS